MKPLHEFLAQASYLIGAMIPIRVGDDDVHIVAFQFSPPITKLRSRGGVQFRGQCDLTDN